jgi:hypothetical protein
VDCLPSQVCTTGVCADHDELLLGTSALPVTNANGYRGDDAGADDSAATSPDAGSDASMPRDATATNDAGGASDAGSSPMESSAESSIESATESGGGSCADGGGIGSFAPSNVPLGFAIPAGAKPWVINEAFCVIDTDALTQNGCTDNFSASVVTLSDGRQAAAVTADSLTVNVGTRLQLAGTRPLIVLTNGKIEINGTVRDAGSTTNGWWGGGAPGSASGDRVGFCALETGPGGGGKGDSTVLGSGAGGGGFCGKGGRGSVPSDAGLGALGGSAYGRADLVPLMGGSGGGSAKGGFTLTYGTNHGGGAVQLVSGESIVIGELGIIDMGGGFAVAASGALEGGGGGSGGAVLLEAPSVVVRGVIAANGSGGGGGYLQSGLEGQPSATPAMGGGIGGSGSAGSTVNGSDAAPWVSGRAGGGGGGAGRIRINTGCGGMLTVTAAAVISPDKTSGCFTEGQLR